MRRLGRGFSGLGLGLVIESGEFGKGRCCDGAAGNKNQSVFHGLPLISRKYLVHLSNLQRFAAGRWRAALGGDLAGLDVVVPELVVFLGPGLIHIAGFMAL